VPWITPFGPNTGGIPARFTINGDDQARLAAMTATPSPSQEHAQPVMAGRAPLTTLAVTAGGAMLVGLVLGATTQALQGILPGALNWVANAQSLWLLVAFLVGSRLSGWRLAAACGVLLLLASLAGYYLTVQLRFGYGGSAAAIAFWGLGALAGGSVFGADGWWWRHGSPWPRALAAGLLAALFLAEGVYFLATLPDPTVGLAAMLIGLALPAALGRSQPERGRAYLATLPGLALAAAGYGATLVAYGRITGA
jgi:Family of unknown function (DUF6518)